MSDITTKIIIIINTAVSYEKGYWWGSSSITYPPAEGSAFGSWVGIYCV